MLTPAAARLARQADAQGVRAREGGWRQDQEEGSHHP